MKQGITKRVGWAWIVLMIFVPQLVVSFLHLHKPKEHTETACHASDKHDRHPAETCELCKYTVSVFTEVELPDFTFVPQITHIARVLYTTKNYHFTSFTHYNLRAPPSTIC